jgi:hypothetical protein
MLFLDLIVIMYLPFLAGAVYPRSVTSSHQHAICAETKLRIFQIWHLLMFPVIGLLCAHGTAGLLQYPMLGHWLAFPTLLILIERITRIACVFHPIPATLETLDTDTVSINVTVPHHRY